MSRLAEVRRLHVPEGSFRGREPVDPEMLLAMQEVDALAPAAPPITPVYGPEESPYAIGFPEGFSNAVGFVNAALDARGVSHNSGMAAATQAQLNHTERTQLEWERLHANAVGASPLDWELRKRMLAANRRA